MLQELYQNYFYYLILSSGIIVATIIINWVFKRFFNRLILHSTTEMQNNPTNYKFIGHIITAVIYLVGFGIAIYVVPSMRALASSMLAGAGILAVAVGFASQHALSNVISGVFIVLFKPFKVNDRLTVRTLSGIVEDITLRHTVIRDFENKRIIIPNTLISDEIIINANFTEDNRICRWIDVPISFDSDIDTAKDIIRAIIINHPLNIDNRTPEQIANDDPMVPVRVLSLSEYAVNLRGWAWAKDAADGFVLHCDVLESIKKNFDATPSITIPYPHREVIVKNDSKGSQHFESSQYG